MSTSTLLNHTLGAATVNFSSSSVLPNSTMNATELSLDDSKLSTLLIYPAILTYSIIFVVGLPGNAAILLAVYVYPQFHRQTYYFLASTAAADILICLLLPLNAISLMMNDWIFGLVLCNIQAYSAPVLFYASALSILFTAMCRYLQVVHYNRLHLVKKTWIHVGLILYTWSIGLLLFLPNMVDPNKTVLFLKVFQSCRLDPNAHQLLLMIGKVLVEVPCPILMVYFYCHIYIKHYKSRRQICMEPQTQTHSVLATISTDIHQRNQTVMPVVPPTPNTRVRLEGRLTRATLLISITFFLSWTIPGLIRISSYYQKHPTSSNVISGIVSRSGPLFHFIINVALNSRMRKAISKLRGRNANPIHIN